MSTRSTELLLSVLLASSAACNAILGNEPGTLASDDAGVHGAGGGTTTASSNVGSNGGTGAEAASSGQGGTGGAEPECRRPDDCPGIESACQARTCDSGVCGITFSPQGTAAADDAGDCLKLVCDGRGGTTSEPDDGDVFDDGNPCTSDGCVGGSPMNEPAASGTACMEGDGKVCDGDGACVECIGNAQCPGGLCQQQQCVPLGCNDTIENGNETDVDCGGADCAPCADGEACVQGADCASGICMVGTCKTPTCTDGVANGAETDVDCGGGACPDLCGPGEGCADDADCIGGECTGSTCAPTCSDSTKNGGETDVDCGGPVCGDCVLGQACVANADCDTGFCWGASHCDPGHCNDGSKSGDESDDDCGGSCTKNCSFGQGCKSGADCASNACALGACL